MHITQVMGGVPTSARVNVPPFPYLGNNWMNCAEIWYVVSDPLARVFTQAKDGTQLHVRTPFHILETAGRIALKFGVWLGYHKLYVLHGMGDICSSARVAVNTLKHMYSLPFVHRPKASYWLYKISVWRRLSSVVGLVVLVGCACLSASFLHPSRRRNGCGHGQTDASGSKDVVCCGGGGNSIHPDRPF